MVQELLEVMPPTATNVDDCPTYTADDPFFTIANAADTEMVSILMEDTDSLPVDMDGDDYPAGLMSDAYDTELAVDEDGELVYRDELRQFVGL
jgi:hypothetical protein